VTNGDPHAKHYSEALKGCKRRPMHCVASAHQAGARLARGRGGGRRRRCRGRPGALGAREVVFVVIVAVAAGLWLLGRGRRRRGGLRPGALGRRAVLVVAGPGALSARVAAVGARLLLRGHAIKHQFD